MPYLEVLNGPEVGKKVELASESFFIGRDPNNHLVLSDRTVSRKHAVINHLEGKYIVSDLKSLKGLLINGVKQEEAALESGDEIALGAVRVRFFGEALEQKSAIPKPGRRLKISIGLLLFLLALAGGVWFWLQPPLENHNLSQIQSHYEKGVELFNHDRSEESLQEWLKVLELDPDQKTTFAKKAAKLLENLYE